MNVRLDYKIAVVLAVMIALLIFARPAAAQGNVIQGGGAGASQRNFSLNFGAGFGGGLLAGAGRVAFGAGAFGRGLAFNRGFNRGFIGRGIGFNRGFYGGAAFAPVYQQQVIRQQVIRQPIVYQQPVVVQQVPVYLQQQQVFQAPAYDVGCGVQTFSRGIRAQVGGCGY